MREIDATRLVEARESLNAELGGRISFLPLFVKAVVTALKQHPRFNASLDMQQQQIVYRHRYNIGIAAATPDGLVVPVLHDADRKSIAELAAEIEALAEAARARKVTVEQISHGTFTITNFGSYGGWLGTPIIRPPEVAIAGFGRVRDAVVPVDGQPAVRKLLPLVVATDHRLNDGEHLNGFMDSLSGYLSDPVRLLGRL
jgi:pyruvate/2-oxoglutarate dehydrogenase complex dihydrolipoamide acyltransferase (E2) component